ncbi:DUF7380 domain-containing protein [Rhizobium laguerreae]|uniref:DUF7380 domain-containing protein n=1 Tax=Rhizobium laguerreae TaxID=1076926 RepID=UPI001FE2D502|nr:hypothetical protein [Rhizobium laguerreae]
MTEHSGNLATETERSGPLYQSATIEDIEKIDFDQVIKGIPSADCREYQNRFAEATERAKTEGDDSAASVYAALAALCGFHFRPTDVNDPFGPMIQMEGRRSAIPSDFRSSASAVALMAERTSDVALKARLSDVAWLLNRRRVDLGLAAISAYCQTVRDVAAGARKFRLNQSNTPYSAQSRNLLKRALSLAVMRSVGLGKPEEEDVRSLVKQLFGEVLEGSNLRDVQRFTDLALKYEIIPPLDIGRSSEDWLRRSKVADGHDRLDLLGLAATAYHKGGSMPDHHRCRLEAADTRVRMSQAENSAMISASLLADAISELHGIPDVKERRRELRHQLVDVQANISDELTSFSQEIDLKEIVAAREASFEGLCLRDMLFYFADMSQSPTPDHLRAEAQQSINDNPFSSILSTSFHDRDGKVSYRSENVDLMSAPTDEALRSTVAEAERIRRQIFAEGDIQTARRLINESYYVTDGTLVALLRQSNFVPAELLRTYGRGFQRFFQGDPVSGLYILTPLLEASIRHVLKGRGYDVSTFDNATKTQQDLTISAMFDQMKTELLEVFGAAFVADIENVFLDQPGPTIRHQIAHGLMTDGNPYGPDSSYACWLIFRLCLITLFPHRENIDEDLWQ